MGIAKELRTRIEPVNGWVKLQCHRCQRDIWKMPSDANKKKHFCSKLCRNETPLIRLMKWVNKYQGTEPTECWLYDRMLNEDGYGHIKMNGKTERANRASWMVFNGPIPDGLLVLHKCIGTPNCINPDHLYLGDQKQNIDDCIRQGRKVVLRGEDHASSVLTEDAVREIRPLKGVVSSEELAIKYGCSKSAIHGVWYGQNWKHVK